MPKKSKEGPTGHFDGEPVRCPSCDEQNARKGLLRLSDEIFNEGVKDVLLGAYRIAVEGIPVAEAERRMAMTVQSAAVIGLMGIGANPEASDYDRVNAFKEAAKVAGQMRENVKKGVGVKARPTIDHEGTPEVTATTEGKLLNLYGRKPQA